MADWLDENFPATPVRVGEIPTGFNSYWHRRVMYHFFPGSRNARQGPGKWSNADIIESFKLAGVASKVRWFANAGATEISSYPVFVTEPRIGDDVALRVCRWLD